MKSVNLYEGTWWRAEVPRELSVDKIRSRTIFSNGDLKIAIHVLRADGPVLENEIKDRVMYWIPEGEAFDDPRNRSRICRKFSETKDGVFYLNMCVGEGVDVAVFYAESKIESADQLNGYCSEIVSSLQFV